MNVEMEDSTIYVVVRNQEEQYSIWPEYRPLPNGWMAVSMKGPKNVCLAYIKEVWKDMRPLSVREKLQGSREA